MSLSLTGRGVDIKTSITSRIFSDSAGLLWCLCYSLSRMIIPWTPLEASGFRSGVCVKRVRSYWEQIINQFHPKFVPRHENIQMMCHQWPLWNNQYSYLFGKVCEKLCFVVSHNCVYWINIFLQSIFLYISQPSYFKQFDHILGLLLCINTLCNIDRNTEIKDKNTTINIFQICCFIVTYIIKCFILVLPSIL